jgi:signal transduction histidine kinase
MSYRSFKRVLGETSLERKCRFLFGLCLFLLITGSFWWYGSQTEKMVIKQTLERDRVLVDTIMMIRHWEALEQNPEYKPLVQHLSANLQNQEYDWQFIRPAGVGSGEGAPKRLDAFEANLLDRLLHATPPPLEEDGPGTVDDDSMAAVEFDRRTVVVAETNEKEFQYYQGVRAKSGRCVSCHRIIDGNAELMEGDLLAVAKVSIPAGPTIKEVNWNRAILLSTAIITVFLAMLAAYAIVRYVIAKPLKHLRDVSDEIGHGNINLRAEIHTGDEFEDLAVAFNRMLQNMIDAHDELRQVNSNLDAKVDQLAQANMRLFEMNRMKSDFLATMSHELRTPLNSIIGFSDVLRSNKSLGEKQSRFVENIQKSGRMLLDMINDLLDLAKIESGKMEVRLTDFSIENIIHTQCDLARPLTEKKNIDMEIKVQPNLPQLHQDQNKIQQILTNLLSNAIKFTPEGGRIVVHARHSTKGRLDLAVEDTGVGIALEDQKTIFEKFRQGNTVLSGGDAMTREYSGTGLGLSIVKELCRLLEGEISVTSELGKGSTFTVKIPWKITEQPKLDSPLAESLEELTRVQRSEYDRRPAASMAESQVAD